QQTKGKEDQLSKNQDDLVEELIERRQDLEHIRKLKESAMPKASRALARPEWNRKNAMAGLGTTFRATAEDAGVFMVAYTPLSGDNKLALGIGGILVASVAGAAETVPFFSNKVQSVAEFDRRK